MMASDQSPIDNEENLVRFHERVKAVLALSIFGSFVLLLVFWTLVPPKMSDAGRAGIISMYQTLMGMVAGIYLQPMTRRLHQIINGNGNGQPVELKAPLAEIATKP